MDIIFGEGVRIAGLTQEQGFGFMVEETPSFSGESEAPGVYEDISYTGLTLTGVQNNCRIHVSDSYLAPGHSFTSLTPETATVDSDGNVSMVSPGPAEIIISTPRSGSKRFTRTMASSGSSTTSRFESFESGSLGAHCVDQMRALITGKTPGSITQRYWSSNSGGVAAPSGVRNAGNFSASVDLSGISMCMSGRDTEKFPMMLISARHAITARHVCPPVGTSVVFQRTNGTYQTVIVTSISHLTVDLSVLYLSAPVTGIEPFKTMPSGFVETYTPAMLGGPVPYVPHGEWPTLQKTVWNPDGTSDSWLAIGNCRAITGGTFIHAISPVDAQLAPWYSGIRGGDSGSPQFFVINGEPILVASHSSPSGSPFVSDNITAINTAMNTLAGTIGTYALNHPDLSGFTTYA